ncbi:coiled-coil-helix-coiled-coil-helix domain containing 3b isoform X2 [Eucyclogobius newberryi]|uniref:coiled-coil-helix-coiled-coil-helix domain containing 3b isoform X2 n=1 Tax=Eucyclogobius newberryi TaxID=166745 RepID=UPI003B5B560F
MGGNGPSQFAPGEEASGVTFVKGIRVSDRVINRMRQSSKVITPPPPQSGPPPAKPETPASVHDLLPLLTPPPAQDVLTAAAPSLDTTPPQPPPVKLVPPPPVHFHSLPPPTVEAIPEPKATPITAPSPSTPIETPVDLPPPAADPVPTPPPSIIESPPIPAIKTVEPTPELASPPPSITEPISPPCYEEQTCPIPVTIAEYVPPPPPPSVMELAPPPPPVVEPEPPSLPLVGEPTVFSLPIEPASVTPPADRLTPSPEPTPVEQVVLAPPIESTPILAQPTEAIPLEPVILASPLESTLSEPAALLVDTPPIHTLDVASPEALTPDETIILAQTPESFPVDLTTLASAIYTGPVLAPAPESTPVEPVILASPPEPTPVELVTLPPVEIVALAPPTEPTPVELPVLAPPSEPVAPVTADVPPATVNTLEAVPLPPPAATTCESVALALTIEDTPPVLSLESPPEPLLEPASPVELAVLLLESTAKASGPAPPSEQVTEILAPPTLVEEVTVVTSELPAEPVPPEVVEDRLRQKIKAELVLSLEEEIAERRQALQKQLEELRAIAIAEAEAAAQAQVEQQVKQTLEAEKAAYMENLTQSIAKERMKTEDEKLMVQLYAHKLEMREEEMKKRDTLYNQHIAKLESKCSQFYKVTADSFQKGKEETHNRFARVNIQPVCGDLQSQILKCYQENPGKTLSCSGIASAYMQCVNKVKVDKMSTRG